MMILICKNYFIHGLKCDIIDDDGVFDVLIKLLCEFEMNDDLGCGMKLI